MSELAKLDLYGHQTVPAEVIERYAQSLAARDSDIGGVSIENENKFEDNWNNNDEKQLTATGMVSTFGYINIQS